MHCPIYFEDDLLNAHSFSKALGHCSGKIALIMEETVAAIYSPSFIHCLKTRGYKASLILFKGGEESKTRETKEKIEEALLSENIERNDLLIVMGGGVTTDLGGFVAATYLRGIRYLSIPTTLLGMVDASIGGKTGVNVRQGKNLIGAFYPPNMIFITTALLSTLPDREILCGSAEVLKYALISDKHFFGMLQDTSDQWKKRNPHFLKKVIARSIKIKEGIVKKDGIEKGIRRILNFGHTIGHAIETLEEFTVSHGQAVALGIIVEAFIAKTMGHIRVKEFDAIYNLVREMGFSLKVSNRVTPSNLQQVMARDKKSKNGVPRFVILNGIGTVYPYKGDYCTSIEDRLLNEALKWMVTEFH